MQCMQVGLKTKKNNRLFATRLLLRVIGFTLLNLQRYLTGINPAFYNVSDGIVSCCYALVVICSTLLVDTIVQCKTSIGKCARLLLTNYN